MTDSVAPPVHSRLARRFRPKAVGETVLPVDRPRLGEQLVRAGLVTSNELESALQRQSEGRGRLGEVLLDLGFVEEDHLLPFLGEQFGVPAVRLREGLIDPTVVQALPRQIAEQYGALALFRVRGELTVALSDPQNLLQRDRLARVSGCRIRPVFAFESTIRRLLSRAYDDNFEVDAVTADLDDDAVEVSADSYEVDLQNMQNLADGSPVINLINYTIVQAIRQGASDIHIEPGEHQTLVRYRVDGRLREILKPRSELHPALVSRVKVMAKMDIAKHREPQDGRIHVRVEKRDIDLRVSTLPTVQGEKVVLRVLDRSNLTFDLDQLGVPGHLLGPIKKMLRRPNGLVLVTGPTGSGKTTTLYSALELIKDVSTNIVTVEDPVEYQLGLINQVHANAATGLGFASVLRSILRQDPDVIMVGEIRDAETAEVAIQAALTGHLVLSTLHTNDSAGAITRLMDMGIAPYKISASVAGVIAQRLVRTICPNCKTVHYPPENLLAELRYSGDSRKRFAIGEGCTQCYDTGFQGRLGIYEVLMPDRDLRDIINTGPTVDQVRDWHRSVGGTRLIDEGIAVAETGLTSLQEVASVTVSE